MPKQQCKVLLADYSAVLIAVILEQALEALRSVDIPCLCGPIHIPLTVGLPYIRLISDTRHDDGTTGTLRTGCQETGAPLTRYHNIVAL